MDGVSEEIIFDIKDRESKKQKIKNISFTLFIFNFSLNTKMTILESQ